MIRVFLNWIYLRKNFFNLFRS